MARQRKSATSHRAASRNCEMWSIVEQSAARLRGIKRNTKQSGTCAAGTDSATKHAWAKDHATDARKRSEGE